MTPLRPDLTFTFLVHEGEDGFYVAYCKEIPGIVSQGRTVEEAVDNLREAFMGAIETLAHRNKAPRNVRHEGKPIETRKVGLVALPV